VLDIKQPILKTLAIGQRGVRTQFKDKVWFSPIIGPLLELHPLLAPSIRQTGKIGFQPVEPRKNRRRTVVPLEQLRGRLAAPAILPPLDQPPRMGIAKSGVG